MQHIIEQQRAYFQSHETKSISFRRKQLKRLKQAILAHEQNLFKAIASDFQKSAFDTYTTELALVYHDIDIALSNLKLWAQTKSVKTNLVNFPAKSYVVPEPLGVALVIGAWNYPYQLCFGPIVPAIAAGCTVVIKPSEIPSATSAAIATLIKESFPANYITVVEGGIPETTALLKQKFDKIFFTGSTYVGKIVYKAAAENLTPVTLELGGKSPAIVAKDANLKMAAKRLVWGKFLNAGQTCIAPDYIWVDRLVQEEFLNLLVAEIRKEKFDVANGNYVQIINTRNLERLEKMLLPKRTVIGGVVDHENRTISPTILKDITFEDQCMQEEIFGPILPVISYTDLDEVISKTIKLPKPLSCYVFSSNQKTKNRIVKEIPFGGGGVNETVMHISNPHLPFGGTGGSGIGSCHGEAGFRAFSHYKSILDKTTMFELPLKYYPHTNKKLWWIKQFFKW